MAEALALGLTRTLTLKRTWKVERCTTSKKSKKRNHDEFMTIEKNASSPCLDNDASINNNCI
eukprot:scaffold4851_cov80-Skeletonema_menzelii.AAC.1